jgi:hypothetical protein
MKTFIPFLLGGIAGSMGAYFGGFMGLLAVVLGQISVVVIKP